MLSVSPLLHIKGSETATAVKQALPVELQVSLSLMQLSDFSPVFSIYRFANLLPVSATVPISHRITSQLSLSYADASDN